MGGAAKEICAIYIHPVMNLTRLRAKVFSLNRLWTLYSISTPQEIGWVKCAGELGINSLAFEKPTYQILASFLSLETFEKFVVMGCLERFYC